MSDRWAGLVLWSLLHAGGRLHTESVRCVSGSMIRPTEVKGHGGGGGGWRGEGGDVIISLVVVGGVSVGLATGSPPAVASVIRFGSDTHPRLLEAVGPPAVVRVVRDVLGLLELLPQPLYPVVVARG